MVILLVELLMFMFNLYLIRQRQCLTYRPYCAEIVHALLGWDPYLPSKSIAELFMFMGFMLIRIGPTIKSKLIKVRAMLYACWPHQVLSTPHLWLVCNGPMSPAKGLTQSSHR